MSETRIDLAMLRARLRRLRRDTLFSMLDEAVGLLSKAKLEQLVRRHLRVESLRADPSLAKPLPLRVAVGAFADASRRGDWFETFDVNSKNCTEQSNGTAAWVAECNRLLDRCVARAKGRRGKAEALEAFEVMFELIEQAGSCDLDIVFFADEGGVWAFGIDWERVLPAWYACFAEVAGKDGSFERRVAEIVARGAPRQSGLWRDLAQTVRCHGAWRP